MAPISPEAAAQRARLLFEQVADHSWLTRFAGDSSYETSVGGETSVDDGPPGSQPLSPADRAALADCLVDQIVAFEQLLAWAKAGQLELMAWLAQLPLPPGKVAPLAKLDLSDLERAEAELAPALVVTRAALSYRMNDARVLQELPRFNAMLRSGQIDERRAMAVVHAMSEYLSSDDPRWALIEERVARRAPERTAFELRGDVLRAVKAIDPALEDQKAAKAKRRCFVSTFPLPDGLAGVEAVLSAEAAAALDTALTAMADAARDAMARQGIRDDRNHQERRAAALGATFMSILDGVPMPMYPAMPPAPRPGSTKPAPESTAPGNPGQGNPAMAGSAFFGPAAPGSSSGVGTQRNATPGSRTPRTFRPANAESGPAPSGAPTADRLDEWVVPPVDELLHANELLLYLDEVLGGDDEESSGLPQSQADLATLDPPIDTGSLGPPLQSDLRCDEVMSDEALLRAESMLPADDWGSGDEPPYDEPLVGQRSGEGPLFAADLLSMVSPAGELLRSLEKMRRSWPMLVPAWWETPIMPVQQRRRPHLVVTISAETLAGHDDLPGELAGYGAITASAARDLAKRCGSADLVILDASNGSRCLSQPGYRPGNQLIKEVMASNKTCRFPGCARPASQCDVDHIISDAEGGPTCACNLAPLCRAHHLIKTFGGWEVYRVQPGTEGLGDGPGEGLGQEPGSLVWISPLGRRYVVPLPDLPGSAHW